MTLFLVVDLSGVPGNLHVVQTAHAGPGASGISISPDGKLALVANTEDSTISIFTISGERIAKAGQVQLASGARPTDVVFTPDGKRAVAIAQRASSLVILSVHGTDVKESGKSFPSGRMPYGAVVTRDGKYVINTNLGGASDAPAPAARRPGRPGGGGGMSRQGTVAMTDPATGNVTASWWWAPRRSMWSFPRMDATSPSWSPMVPLRCGSDPNFNKVLGLLEGLLSWQWHADAGRTGGYGPLVSGR